MTYKGYSAALEVDEEAGELFGRVQGTRHIITFQGATVEEARRSFEETVDAYLEACRESGEVPDRPFSGDLRVRVAPETHRELAKEAERRKVSPEEVVSDLLNSAFVEGGDRPNSAEGNLGETMAAERTTAEGTRRQGKRA